MRVYLTGLLVILVAASATAEPHVAYNSNYGDRAQAATGASLSPAFPPQGTVYAGQPVYTPHYPQDVAPTQHPQPQPNERPGEYGQSVMTDIRQMNF